MSTSMTSSPTRYASYLATTRASVLIERIHDLTDELQRDLARADRKRLYCEIRDIRRSLSSLEYELCEEEHDGHGDAC